MKMLFVWFIFIKSTKKKILTKYKEACVDLVDQESNINIRNNNNGLIGEDNNYNDLIREDNNSNNGSTEDHNSNNGSTADHNSNNGSTEDHNSNNRIKENHRGDTVTKSENTEFSTTNEFSNQKSYLYSTEKPSCSSSDKKLLFHSIEAILSLGNKVNQQTQVVPEPYNTQTRFNRTVKKSIDSIEDNDIERRFIDTNSPINFNSSDLKRKFEIYSDDSENSKSNKIKKKAKNIDKYSNPSLNHSTHNTETKIILSNDNVKPQETIKNMGVDIDLNYPDRNIFEANIMITKKSNLNDINDRFHGPDCLNTTLANIIEDKGTTSFTEIISNLEKTNDHLSFRITRSRDNINNSTNKNQFLGGKQYSYNDSEDFSENEKTDIDDAIHSPENYGINTLEDKKNKIRMKIKMQIEKIKKSIDDDLKNLFEDKNNSVFENVKEQVEKDHINNEYISTIIDTFLSNLNFNNLKQFQIFNSKNLQKREKKHYKKLFINLLNAKPENLPFLLPELISLENIVDWKAVKRLYIDKEFQTYLLILTFFNQTNWRKAMIDEFKSSIRAENELLWDKKIRISKKFALIKIESRKFLVELVSKIKPNIPSNLYNTFNEDEKNIVLLAFSERCFMNYHWLFYCSKFYHVKMLFMLLALNDGNIGFFKTQKYVKSQFNTQIMPEEPNKNQIHSFFTKNKLLKFFKYYIIYFNKVFKVEDNKLQDIEVKFQKTIKDMENFPILSYPDEKDNFTVNEEVQFSNKEKSGLRFVLKISASISLQNSKDNEEGKKLKDIFAETIKVIEDYYKHIYYYIIND